MDDLRYQRSIKEEAKENVDRKHDNYVIRQYNRSKQALVNVCWRNMACLSFTNNKYNFFPCRIASLALR